MGKRIIKTALCTLSIIFIYMLVASYMIWNVSPRINRELTERERIEIVNACGLDKKCMNNIAEVCTEPYKIILTEIENPSELLGKNSGIQFSDSDLTAVLEINNKLKQQYDFLDVKGTYDNIESQITITKDRDSVYKVEFIYETGIPESVSAIAHRGKHKYKFKLIK